MVQRGPEIGLIAAKWRGKLPDTASSIFVLLGTSLPTFVTGIALIVWVSIKWELIPPSLEGYVSFTDDPKGYFYYFILAWITLAIAYAAFYTRFTRASVLETMGEEKGMEYLRALAKQNVVSSSLIVRSNYGDIMEEKQPSQFKQEWEAKKLLKRSKKKAKKSLETQGFGRKEASKEVNAALQRIMSNKPVKRAAGRGG